jgi:DNA modification methylase
VDVRLVWPGRIDGPIEIGGARLEPIGEPADAPVRLIEGDNLVAMRALVAEGLEGAFTVAYLDPPYRSGAEYVDERRGVHAYDDRWSDRGAYLDMLWPRLRLVHRLLAPHGTIWVQVDHRASGLVQPLLDELFGDQRLRNVIAWRRAPPLGRQVQSRQFPRNVDLLFAYAKGERARWRAPWTRVPLERTRARRDPETGRHYTLAPRGDYTDESIARLESEGRIHRTAKGAVYVKYFVEEVDGVLYKPRAVDALWDDVAPLRHAPPKERTGYPTQKPEPLLSRIIEATSDPGDLVLDPFAGSGTTGIVAARLGRRAVLVDRGETAIATMRARLGSGSFAHARAVDPSRGPSRDQGR